MKKIAALLLGLTLAGSAFAGGKKGGDACCPVGSNASLVKNFYKDVLNAHKIEDFEKFCAKGFRDHNPDPGQKGDLKGVMASFKLFFAAFPDAKVEVKEIMEDGNLVMVRLIMSGTQKGEFMGMPASGKKFRVQGFDLIKLNKDGKATDRWGTFDNLAMMEQLTPKKK